MIYALQRASKLPPTHILHHIASVPVFHHEARLPRHRVRAKADNIWIIKEAIAELPPLQLCDPITRIGSRLLDITDRVIITIPAALPRSSKVFSQWAEGWLRECHNDSKSILAIGSDGSYIKKGQGVSAFVVQMDQHMVHTEFQLVVAHSSYDAEMKAINMVIKYVLESVSGAVITFIDNQAVLKTLFLILLLNFRATTVI